MGNKDQEQIARQSGRGFWMATGALFIYAVAARWIRLDWMTFLLDQAAVCSRAAMVRSGQVPFTGIVNSMGFHNAPGYVWTLLPVFVFTTNPVIAAAWHGLLSASMVIPLALLGRKYRRDGLRWLPAIIAAVMPAYVFAGRDLWAQHLNLALGAWMLYALDAALEPGAAIRRRQTMATVAAALAAWAVSVHYGAAPALLVVAGALLPMLKRMGKRATVAILVPAALICLTMLPSILDFVHRQSNPLPKPAHALRLESVRAEDLPVWARLAHAAEVSVLTRSLDAVPGLYELLPSNAVDAIFSLDVLLTGLALGGAVTCLYQLVRRNRSTDPPARRMGFCEILLMWLLFPAVAGALLLKQINPGYLSASLPAGWLLILFLPQANTSAQRASVRWITRAAAILVLAAGSTATAFLLTWVLSSSGQIRAYEMPYALQKDAAAYILQRGIAPDRIRHLSGPVFGESYRYIAWHLEARYASQREASDEFALITDLPWLEPYPERRALLEQSGATRVGPILILTQSSRGSVEIFTRRYLELN